MAFYRTNPIAYAEEVLGITLWDQIAEMLLALLKPPYRVSVDSAHNVGKSHAAAVAVNWWFDTRDPGVVITTAPTKDHVVKVLWSEVRLQRMNAIVPLPNVFIGPYAPEMRTSPDHWAIGFTTSSAEAFHGKHRANMLFIFDEKEKVEGPFWQAVKSMLRPGSGDAWLAIGNPFTTSSIAYQEHRAVDGNGDPTWHRVRLSALEHPNIVAHVEGKPLVYPNALTPGQLTQFCEDWCDHVVPGDEQATDIVWEGHCYRPGPLGQPRILGLRPDAGTFGIWSEAAWAQVMRQLDADFPFQMLDKGLLPIIGCDVANYGPDYTAFHVRIGPVSLFHQWVNGWKPDRVNGRLMDLAREWSEWCNNHRDKAAVPINAGQIEIRIDDDGEGRTLASYLQTQRYRVIPVNAASNPRRPDLYPNCRCEMWFLTARKATQGMVNMSRLNRETVQRIEMQAMAPEWWPDTAGRRIVESKDDLRKPERLGRSPDDMDAVNLAYYEPSGVADARWVDVDPPVRLDRPEKQAEIEGSVVNRMKRWYAEAPESTKLW